MDFISDDLVSQRTAFQARIFMERLLNEKRVKKLREQEEARIRELEAQKAEIERVSLVFCPASIAAYNPAFLSATSRGGCEKEEDLVRNGRQAD